MPHLIRMMTLVLLSLLPTLVPASQDNHIRIGVLSHRGDIATARTWKPTAEYLTASLPGFAFSVVPLDFSAVDPAVAGEQVDFVLVNPSIYVNLEVRHRVSRIATMRNRAGKREINVFGGVIFTLASNQAVRALKDLQGRSLMAVDQTSLGGFEMAWGELQRHGIDPHEDLSELRFGGIHDEVVNAVTRGDVDAGTVRTDILERMGDAGLIDLGAYRILNQQPDPDFPFLRSTPLYPEWPFSKLKHTSNALAQQVAIALLSMPSDHPATRAGAYAGWTVPLDYQTVHGLLERLQLPPYNQVTPFTLTDAIKRYWIGVLLGCVALCIMILLTLWVMRLNKRLSRAKARLEQHHELLLDSVAEGICGIDMDGRTTFVNKAMERMTGWRADELINCHQHALLHHTRADGSPHPVEECPIHATFLDSRPRFVEDDIFWRKDGTGFPVEYSSTPILDEQRDTVGSVVVFRDMTERKEAAERIRRHRTELAHVARLSTLGEMASGIAHELNQPLTAISTNARACVRMLESGRSVQEQCSDVMDRIAEQAERAGKVIRQIRHFVRKEEPDIRPVRLSGMLDTVAGLLRQDVERAGVSLTLDRAGDAEWVLAQEIQIEQVIINLARNAIEAMAETQGPRHLVIGAHRHGADQVEIQVRDTGPGLAPEIAESLFDPFITTKPQGLGLGLSISYGIVDAHGGQLAVESGAASGACFRFTLPASTGANQDAD